MSLQSRLLLLFLPLLLVVLAVTLGTLWQATYRHTLERARGELAYAERILLDKLESRRRGLQEAAGTLAKEDALRQAIFTDVDDAESMRVALDNHRRRTSADLAILVDLEGRILADTRGAERAGGRHPLGAPPSQPGAADASRSLGLVVFDDVAHQLVAAPYYVPVSAPRPSLWLLLGRRVDDDFARQMSGLMGVEVSILERRSGAPPAPAASSLAGAARGGLAAAATAKGDVVILGEERYLIRRVELAASPGFAALLAQPTAEALLDFRQLSGRLLGVALLAALLALGGALLLSRSVTRPVRGLARAAQRIAAGDYSAELPPSGIEELSGLAHELEQMQREIREREAAIHHLAYHDDLTGLPNRNAFRGALDEAIADSAREHRRLAVAVIDLDRFKEINDTLGHHVGDRLLIAVAQRMRELAAAGGARVARLGGDELALLLPIDRVREAGDAIAELRAGLGREMEIDDLRVHVEASVGIAVYPDSGGDAATLLRQAEVAMYVAKARHLGHAFYDSTQDHHSVHRLELASDLRRAAERGELYLVYQPKMDLAGGEVQQVEALVRWRHPHFGEVSPGDFIPIAEQTGTIRHVTSWVLGEAFAQLAAWRRAGLELSVAVNLSALELHDADLVPRLAAGLAAHGADPRHLVLEITESSVMADPDAACRMLDQLAAMGITLSIDDFGTGYSSLAQLQRLPVRELKVDRSFVSEMTRSADVRSIVRSTIELGHNLGLRVVAEGVEDGATLELLAHLSCDLAQGYHVSPPLAPEPLADWLAERRPLRQGMA